MGDNSNFLTMTNNMVKEPNIKILEDSTDELITQFMVCDKRYPYVNTIVNITRAALSPNFICGILAGKIKSDWISQCVDFDKNDIRLYGAYQTKETIQLKNWVPIIFYNLYNSDGSIKDVICMIHTAKKSVVLIMQLYIQFMKLHLIDNCYDYSIMIQDNNYTITDDIDKICDIFSNTEVDFAICKFGHNNTKFFMLWLQYNCMEKDCYQTKDGIIGYGLSSRRVTDINPIKSYDDIPDNPDIGAIYLMDNKLLYYDGKNMIPII